MSVVERIFIAPDAQVDCLEIEEATVLAGAGIDGDRYAKRCGTYSWGESSGRNITMISAEVLEDISKTIPISGLEARRNFLTRGVDLNGLIGYQVRVGDTVLINVTRPCHPCNYLQILLDRQVLKPMVGRGGIRCDAIVGGVVRRGDKIEIVEKLKGTFEMPAAAKGRDD